MLKDYEPLKIPPPPSVALLREDEKWHLGGPPIHAPQGWKIYVSASRTDFLETLALVVPILEAHKVGYKYVASDKALRKLNAGLYGYSQVGKVIVAYPQSEAKIPGLVVELKAALSKLVSRAPPVPFAAEIGGGWPIYYRYGSYFGRTIVIDGVERDDDRTRPANELFDLVGDPFASVTEISLQPVEFNRLLLRYPIYETLSQGGKGGVFAAFDVEAERFAELILKIGYRNGQVLPDGRDGMDLIAHERRFFQMLVERGAAHVAPEILDYFSFDQRNVLVMDRIEGTNLLVLREKGELRVQHLEATLELLDQIHAVGLYVGDAKLANFLADPNSRIWAIDFESAGDLSAPRFDMLRTFHFSQPKIRDHALLDRIHLLYSALHEGDKVSFSESDRIIDLDVFRSNFEPAADFQHWALAQLNKEICRIHHPGDDSGLSLALIERSKRPNGKEDLDLAARSVADDDRQM